MLLASKVRKPGICVEVEDLDELEACVDALTAGGDRSPTYKALAEHRVAVALEQVA